MNVPRFPGPSPGGGGQEAEPLAQTLWLRWLLPVAVLVVSVLTLWAWRVKPLSNLVSGVRATGSAALSATSPRPLPAWRLRLELDPERLAPPGPEWLLFTGHQPGTGCELHWSPGGEMELLRSSGGTMVVLGAANLAKAPSQVVLAQHGLKVEVYADDHLILDCLDPRGTQAQDAWGFQASAAVGEVDLTVHDDAGMIPSGSQDLQSGDISALAAIAGDLGRPDHALAELRYLFALDPDRHGTQILRTIHDASVGIAALGPTQPDHDRLQAWLAWQRVRLACQGENDDTEAVERATAAFRVLDPLDGPRQRIVELPGLLLSLIDPIAARACRRPHRPTPPEEEIRRRRLWLGLLAQVGYAAMDAGPPEGEHLHWQLRLIVQASECLVGSDSQPLPASGGPPWLISRWLAVAGRDPAVTTYPPIPTGWQEIQPIRSGLDQVLAQAELEPLPALSMVARIMDALGRHQGAEALAALHAGPEREAVLAQAMLALRGIGHSQDALHALLQNGPGHVPWVQRDPLAYALERLLKRRTGQSVPVQPGGSVIGGIDESIPGGLPSEVIPDSLGPFERLLSGRPNAVDEAWMADAAVVSGPQALAAALAMQEVDGLKPNWSLLDECRCFTVPLILMEPGDRRDGDVPPTSVTPPPMDAAPLGPPGTPPGASL